MRKKTQHKKLLKTFFIKEVKANIVKQHTTYLFKYKHLENILNILLQQQLQYNNSLFLTLQNNKNNNVKLNSSNAPQNQQDLTTQIQLTEQLTQSKETFNLLLNPIIMKAVLMGNSGGPKTKHNISKVNLYFNNDINKLTINNHNNLFIQAKEICKELNDKNVSMIVRRLRKDWSNYFDALKKYNQNPSVFNGQPSYPKAKKLSKVFNYSVPLESSKFSIKKKGILGITLGKKMQDIYIGQADYFKDKKINNVTVSYSHGCIYYHFTYEYTNKQTKVLANENNIIDNISKKAGIDVGVENTLSLFIIDQNTKSLIFSGKELISYNTFFNKQLAKFNELVSYEVKSFKNITDKNNIVRKVPEVYTNKGKSLIKERSKLFERRKLYFDDYMQKLSKKMVDYLVSANVTDLTLSKNLSFTKITGEIKMRGKTKQKFYQIPFGRLLNLIEGKAIENLINVTWINEAYTSKTSSISAEVTEVQNKAKIDKNLIKPNDLNGNRGVKKKNKLNNKMGRGLFLDSVINKVINADLNAACNHIKIAFTEIDKNVVSQLSLSKFCNPMKIKSNHEFDKILKNIKLKNNIGLSSSNNQIVDRKLGRKYYLSDVETQKQD